MENTAQSALFWKRQTLKWKQLAHYWRTAYDQQKRETCRLREHIAVSESIEIISYSELQEDPQ